LGRLANEGAQQALGILEGAQGGKDVGSQEFLQIGLTPFEIFQIVGEFEIRMLEVLP
jgi:hypothetical protein